MAEVFDSYYIWLGIPPEEQPADHYRLLGIRRFESNDEVIANAADQRVRHLRSMQTGKRQAETQKLLNEISAASAVLLDPDMRREYDASLAVPLGPVAGALLPFYSPPVAGRSALRPLPVRPGPITRCNSFVVAGCQYRRPAQSRFNTLVGYRRRGRDDPCGFCSSCRFCVAERRGAARDTCCNECTTTCVARAEFISRPTYLQSLC